MGRVLVTGAGGFVGVNLARGLAERGWSVVALARRAPDALTSAFLAPVAGEVLWRLGDVTDSAWLAATIAAAAPEAIVHAAAMTPSPEVERSRTHEVVATNLSATVDVLEAARRSDVRRLVYASSTGVYAGAALGRARREDEPLVGRNLYAHCKLASEGLVRLYAELHHMSACSLRIGSVYGPMERASGSRTGLSLVARLLPWAQAGGHLMVHGADVGRDLIHASDVAAAVAALLTANELRHDVYNLASAAPYPVRDVLDAMAHSAGASWGDAEAAAAELVFTSEHHRDGVDLSRLGADCGWAPQVGLVAGVAHTLAWNAAVSDDLAAAGASMAPPLA